MPNKDSKNSKIYDPSFGKVGSWFQDEGLPIFFSLLVLIDSSNRSDQVDVLVWHEISDTSQHLMDFSSWISLRPPLDGNHTPTRIMLLFWVFSTRSFCRAIPRWRNVFPYHKFKGRLQNCGGNWEDGQFTKKNCTIVSGILIIAVDLQSQERGISTRRGRCMGKHLSPPCADTYLGQPVRRPSRH